MPVIFSILPEYCEAFKQPEATQKADLRSLFSENYAACTYETLTQKAESFLSAYVLSDDTVKRVEASTKQQSRSQQWFLHRAGRVTASVMRRVCHTNVDKPSVSLLKIVCYPEKQSLRTPAVMWGINHEQDALRAYQAKVSSKHKHFTCQRSGLHLSTEHPFVGATPDALVSCTCCGKGVAEFKCPYLLCNAKDFNSANTCLTEVNGVMELQKSHAYYYQVQTQMAICDVDYCDFVVWAPHLLHVERIRRDTQFCNEMFSCARKFFVKAVLPELFSKYFTRQQNNTQDTFCFCNGPETGKMIACDNVQCVHKWFHFSCVQLTRAPKTKKWYCPMCKNEGK